MAAQQDLVEITHLKRTANNTWTFRFDLESIHAPFVENLLHALARSDLFRGGWFMGNWWFDDEGMVLISRLFSNWEVMKAEALAVEGRIRDVPPVIAQRSER